MSQSSGMNDLQLKKLFEALLSEDRLDFGMGGIETSRSGVLSVEVYLEHLDNRFSLYSRLW